MIFFLILFLFLALGSAAPKTIAISPFEARSLYAEQAIKIMKRERVDLIYNEQELQKSVSTSEQMKMDQMLKVDHILTDSFSQTENKIIAIVKLIHVETRTINKITKLLETPFSEENIARTGINEAYFVLIHTHLFPMKL